MLLLLMYLAPFVAALAWWRARRRPVSSFLGGDEEMGLLAAAGTLAARAAVTVRPLAIALGGVLVAVAAVGGFAHAFVFALGIAVYAIAEIVARSFTAGTAGETEDGEGSAALLMRCWRRGSDEGLALAAVTLGTLGALAWFFADPTGVVVIAVFAAGVAAAAAFAVAVGAAAGALPAAHLAAVAAVAMIAAGSPAEELLPLGGLSAESEILRNDLVLFPVALAVLTVVASITARFVTARSIPSRSASAWGYSERIASGLMAVFVMMLVGAVDLDRSLAWVFIAGLVARQVLLAMDTRLENSGTLRAPVVVAALWAWSFQAAGIYGVGVAALAMTAMYAVAAARSAAHDLLASSFAAPSPMPGRLASADAGTSLAALLAVIAALGPTLFEQAARDGVTAPVASATTPTFVASALLGALCARALAPAFSSREDESDPVVRASVLACSGVVGGFAIAWIAGATASIGALLGASCVAAADAGAAGNPGETGRALLVWVRTAALCTLIATPWMV